MTLMPNDIDAAIAELRDLRERDDREREKTEIQALIGIRERVLALADELDNNGIEGHWAIAAAIRRRVAGKEFP